MPPAGLLPDTQYSVATQQDHHDVGYQIDETQRSEALLSPRLVEGEDELGSPIPGSPSSQQVFKVPLKDADEHSAAQYKMSMGSSKSGSTQAFSQDFFQPFTRPSKLEEAVLGAGSRDIGKRSDTGKDTDHTFITGRTHPTGERATNSREEKQVDGLDGNEQADAEDSEDDFDDFIQAEHLVSQFPEERRFQAPKTPASRGKKRSRHGEVLPGSGNTSAPATTPRVPVNPFATRGPMNAAVLPLTQAFNATQAPSSPFLEVPPSDGLSDRPSPNIWNAQQGVTGPASSPAKMRRPPINRSYTEPHGHYVSMTASQQERDRIQTSPLVASDPQQHSDGLLDDEFAPGSSEVRRFVRLQREQIYQESRKIFEDISGVVDDADQSKRRRKGLKAISSPADGQSGHYLASQPEFLASPTHQVHGTKRRKPSSPIPQLRSGNVPNVMEEEDFENPFGDLIDLDGEETQLEMSDDAVDGNNLEQEHDSSDADKENAGHDPVLVPRTVSKRSRHIVVGPRPSSQESGLPPYRTDSQLVAVANSQPNDNIPATQHETQLPAVVERSESQVPDSTEAGQGNQPKTRMSSQGAAKPPSQQNATPPSSSPSPQRYSPLKRVVSHGRAHAKTSPRKGWDDTKPEDELTSPSTPKPQLKRVVAEIGDVRRVESPATSPIRTPVQDRNSEALPTTVPETISANPSLQLTGSKVRTTDPSMEKFETQSHLMNTPKQSPVRKKSRIPRKFTDIVQPQSPGDRSLDFLQDISVLTSEDQEFRERLGRSPASSPIRPVRKRIRPLGTARQVPLLNTERHSSPIYPVSSSEFNSKPTMYHTATAGEPKQSEGQVSGSSADQATTLSREPGSSEKENSLNTRKRRPIVVSTPDSDTHSANESDAPDLPVLPTSSKRSRSRLQSKQVELSSASEQTSSNEHLGDKTDTNHAPPQDNAATSIFAPARVWAYFNGKATAAFYPAIYFGQAEPGRIRVRFDDGSVDIVSAPSVKRLELRIGDVVKIDNGKERKMSSFVLQDLQDNLTGGTQSPVEQTTDINGWSLVKVALRTNEQTLEQRVRPVPVASLYLTRTLFNNLKGRDFTDGIVLPELPVISTPITPFSAPDTPGSRQRRLKSSMKKEGNLRQSFRSNSSSQGLFIGMAFVITAIKDRKSDLERSITSHGGSILPDGLDSIFDIPDEGSSQSSDGMSSLSFGLNSEYQSTGFTALITDRHCRTQSYLCALALNIPCISICWVRDCVERGEVLDWRHYLLPSGESQVLEGAVISRMINIPPEVATAENATNWPLSSIFEARRRPLKGQNMIVISNDKRTNAFLFIGYALGAETVCLVAGWKEANDLLKSKQTKWDWICVPDELSGDKRGRKRKFQSVEGAADLKIGWKDGIRVVKPEFMVQSLILGRLVAE